MIYPDSKFSELLNISIYDDNGGKIGKLIDAIFKISATQLELTKLVIGGSALEEFLEKIKVKKDRDPVFPMSDIKKFNLSRINLRSTTEELKSTELDKDALEENEMRFSQIRKMSVFDPEETKIGNLIDLRFKDNKIEFILGDGYFTELLEDLGLKEDLDFIITNDIIAKIQDNHIHLNQSKEELKQIVTRYESSNEYNEAIYLHHPYMM